MNKNNEINQYTIDELNEEKQKLLKNKKRTVLEQKQLEAVTMQLERRNNETS